MNFERFADSVASIHRELQRAAVGSVNRFLTMRNWLIGHHIVEYEQEGEDRARYGEALLVELSQRLRAEGVKGVSLSSLKDYRRFYLVYRWLAAAVVRELGEVNHPRIGRTVSGQLECSRAAEELLKKSQTVSGEFQEEIDQDIINYGIMIQRGLSSFSFSHFVELMRIEDSMKRCFYELEAMKGDWSVSQLKRQIESLLYERTGISIDKKGLVDSAHREANNTNAVDQVIRDPYILEFAGLPEYPKFSENDLETALLDHIQHFLLELGSGFCFEARQKRITLDNEHDRIDLVFYHRILRCHILIDLKVRKFRHSDAGQMNFYVNFYRDNMMAEGDNPPVGLILCTHRDETVVKYATGGLDNRLFVSKYLTSLPSEETMRHFLLEDRKETECRLEEARPKYGE